MNLSLSILLTMLPVEMLMAKILVVEDDVFLVNKVKELLEAQGHSIDISTDGKDALEKLDYFQFDLLILDWQLPTMSGIEICKQYRGRGGKIPILMLTGRSNSAHKDEGLDTGADDYLTKPFDEVELRARIRALLRRPHTYTGTTLKIADISIELDTRLVLKGQKQISLVPLEYSLLEFLMRHEGQAFSLDALLDRVWKTGTEVSVDAVRTCVKTLRRKIGNPDGTSIIQTVHGIGYRASDSLK